jgi:hypothetical protein
LIFIHFPLTPPITAKPTPTPQKQQEEHARKVVHVVVKGRVHRAEFRDWTASMTESLMLLIGGTRRKQLMTMADREKLLGFPVMITNHMQEKRLMWTFSNMTSYDLARLLKKRRFSGGKSF